MEPKGDNALTGSSRWACPPAELSKTRTSSHSSHERELLIPRDSDRSAPDGGLPEGSRRRLQMIGCAATGVAASVWLMGAIWVWQIGA